MNRLPPFVFIVISALVACAPAGGEPPPPPEATGEIQAAIVNGSASDDSENAAVLVMHYDALTKGGGTTSGCSGTLLTPRLVLTARHCVSITDDGAACTANGTAVSGGVVTGDYSASAIYVFGGTMRPDLIGGTAHPSIGQEILTTGAKTLCNEDLAMVLLTAPVEGAIIAPIRLDGGPKKGEKGTAVGWGMTETERDPQTRRQRTGITILDVGPAVALGPAEFTVGEGPCSGDSGGPIFSAAGAVIGSLSRGGNAAQGSGLSQCLGGTNIYVQAAAHADFIRSGYAKAEQSPWLEGTPNPTQTPLGLACAGNGDCQSALCDADNHRCTQTCSATPCLGGYVCANHAAGPVCVAVSAGPVKEGCALVAPGVRPGAISWLAIASSLVVLFRARRGRKT